MELERLEEFINEGSYKAESDPLPTEDWFHAELWKHWNLVQEFEDSWKRRVVYYYPARYGDKEFDLYSLGEDGIDDHGGGDDISNWAGCDRDIYIKRRRKRATTELLAWLTAAIVLLGICALLSCSRLRFCFLSRCPACNTRLKGRLFVAPKRCFSCEEQLATDSGPGARILELLCVALVVAVTAPFRFPYLYEYPKLHQRRFVAAIGLLLMVVYALLRPYCTARTSANPTPQDNEPPRS